MAVTATRTSGASGVWGNKRVRVYDLAFSGNYPTGGESVTASDVGLSQKIEQAFVHGSASETDLSGAWITKVDYQSDGSVKIALFEGAGAGVVPTQKPAEAYESAAELRVTFIGV